MRVRGESDTWATRLAYHRVPPPLARGDTVRMVGLTPNKLADSQRRALGEARVALEG